VFLEKELKVQQEMALINRKYMNDDRKQGLYCSNPENVQEKGVIEEESNEEYDQQSSHFTSSDHDK
jgi:hypothetical protein